MTRTQQRIYRLLLDVNKSSQRTGEPYIRQPEAVFTQICELISDANGQLVIKNFDKIMTTSFVSNTHPDEHPEPINPSEAEPAGKIETLLWNVYMFSGGNGEVGGVSRWTVMRQALAELIAQAGPFALIAQNKATNALPALFKRDLQIDILGNASAKIKDVTFTVSGYTTLAGGIGTTAQMLFDAFMIQYAQQHSPVIEMPLKEYARLRGLSETNTKDLRRQVLDDMAALASISYQCEERIKGKRVPSGEIRLNGGTHVISNGVIRWNFNADLIPQLDRLAPMEYAKETLLADPRTNQYYFSRYIDTNYRINEGRDRVNTISIATMITKTPNLPKIEDVKAQRGSPKQKIIEPFFRDLDAIERLYYDVIDEAGQIINDPLALSYEAFIKCSIRIDYSDYANHKNRVAAKQRRAKAAGKKRSAQGEKP